MSTKTVYTGPLTTLTAINADSNNVLTSSGCAGEAGSYDCSGCTYGVQPNGTAGVSQSFGVNWETGVIVDLLAGCFVSIITGSDGVLTVGASETPTKWEFSFEHGSATPYIYTIGSHGEYMFLCMSASGPYLFIVNDPTVFNSPDGLWWFVSAREPTIGGFKEWKLPKSKKHHKKGSGLYLDKKREDEWLIWGAAAVGLVLLGVMAAK